MKPKTVAARAAELGVDQHELVRTLRLLSRRNLKTGPRKRVRRYGYSYNTRPSTPYWSEEKAAELLGVDSADASAEMKKLDYKSWSIREIIDAIFAFYKEHDRFPMIKDFKLANGLPPREQAQWRAGGLGYGWNVGTRDAWERRIAGDKRCTPKMALYGLRNALARSEAIKRIGFDTFIKNGMASVIEEDPEYGTLYRLPGETAKEPLVLLKVINSTPEPDGSFAAYYLRVPPTMRNVREAVRWTFGGDEALGSQAYEPIAQT